MHVFPQETPPPLAPPSVEELGLTGSAIKGESFSQQRCRDRTMGGNNPKGLSDVRAVLNNAIQDASAAALNHVSAFTAQSTLHNVI